MIKSQTRLGVEDGGQQVGDSGTGYPTSIKIIYPDGESKYFRSVKACALYLGVGYNTVGRKVDSEIPFHSKKYPEYDGIIFRSTDDKQCDYDLSGFIRLEFKELKQMYFINEYGVVFSTYNNDVLKQSKDRDGYLSLSLRKKNNETTKQRVATLVAYSFIGSPPLDMEDPTVDHIDKDRTNNHFSNLRWIERGENARIAHVGISIGDNNHFFGKTHSDDMKEKMRELNTGKKYSKETNAKKASPKISIAIYQDEVIEFSSAKSLSEHLNTTYGTCVRYLRGDRGGALHWYKPHGCYLFYKDEISDIEISNILGSTGA